MSATSPAPATTPRSRERLTLLLIANSVGIGGAETQLARLALGCAARGHEVVVATMLEEPGYQAQLQAAGVRLVRLRAEHWRAGPRALLAGVRLARALRPDAVVGFDYQSSLAARLIGRITRVPTVISSIRNEHFGGRGRAALLRATDAMATVTTTNSRSVADRLIERRVVSRERMRVVPNGIDVSVLQRPAAAREGTRAALGIHADAFLWLAVSYLRPTKDLGSLLAAFARLAGQPRLPHLVIAGSGPLHGELEAAARALGVADRVQLLGERDDVPELLAAADATVLPSWAEGLPNAVMESLALGVPVVATDVGGTAELVTDGRVGGLLVPPRHVDALAAAMQRMMAMSDPERLALGRAGAEHIASGYGIPAALDAWEALFAATTRRPAT